jgi:hypothetical protein
MRTDIQYEKETFKLHYLRNRNNLFKKSILTNGTKGYKNKLQCYSINFVQNNKNNSKK